MDIAPPPASAPPVGALVWAVAGALTCSAPSTQTAAGVESAAPVPARVAAMTAVIRSGAMTAGLPGGGHGVGWISHRLPPAEPASGVTGLQQAEDWVITMAAVIAKARWRISEPTLARRMWEATGRPSPAWLLEAGRAVVSAAAHVERAGGTWAPPPEPGAYARIPCWYGEQAWLNSVDADLVTEAGEQARRRHRVAARTLRAIAQADARAADPKTGRDVLTSNAEAARRADTCIRQARAARAWLKERGFQAVVEQGRYLTRDERSQARNHHGGHQTRCASLRACTQPASVLPPPKPAPKPRRRRAGRGGRAAVSAGFRHLSPKVISSSVISGEEKRTPKRARKRATPGTAPTAPIEARRLAARLAHWCPQNPLGDPSPGTLSRLAKTLANLGVPDRFATADQLLDALVDPKADPGTWYEPTVIANPLAFHLAKVKRLMARLEPLEPSAPSTLHQAVQARRSEPTTRACPREARKARPTPLPPQQSETMSSRPA